MVPDRMPNLTPVDLRTMGEALCIVAGLMEGSGEHTLQLWRKTFVQMRGDQTATAYAAHLRRIARHLSSGADYAASSNGYANVLLVMGEEPARSQSANASAP